MNILTTFGQLRAAIEAKTIKDDESGYNMEAGYEFFRDIFYGYLLEDQKSGSPRFICNQPGIDNDEKYQKALDEMLLTDEFWYDVETRARVLTGPLDRTVPHNYDEAEIDEFERKCQDSGNDIMEFLELIGKSKVS